MSFPQKNETAQDFLQGILLICAKVKISKWEVRTRDTPKNLIYFYTVPINQGDSKCNISVDFSGRLTLFIGMDNL